MRQFRKRRLNRLKKENKPRRHNNPRSLYRRGLKYTLQNGTVPARGERANGIPAFGTHFASGDCSRRERMEEFIGPCRKRVRIARMRTAVGRPRSSRSNCSGLRRGDRSTHLKCAATPRCASCRKNPDSGRQTAGKHAARIAQGSARLRRLGVCRDRTTERFRQREVHSSRMYWFKTVSRYSCLPETLGVTPWISAYASSSLNPTLPPTISFPIPSR